MIIIIIINYLFATRATAKVEQYMNMHAGKMKKRIKTRCLKNTKTIFIDCYISH